MGRRLLTLGLIATSALSFSAGCSTKACTLIGCTDTFVATVKRADGSFPSGTHRIEILADSVTTMCTFSFPLGTAPGGGTLQPQCPSGLNVGVGPAEMCTEVFTTTTVSRHCEPVPGQFVETITVMGTPAQVHAWQYVDDTPILDAATAPGYREVFPNGTTCPPVCHLAEVSWPLD